MKNQKKWEKKENKDAKDFGGKRVKASGSLWYLPGDVKTDQFLIDSKHTEKKSYSLTLKTWNKLYDEALFTFRIPILSPQIQDTELVVLDKDDFLKILSLVNLDDLKIT